MNKSRLLKICLTFLRAIYLHENAQDNNLRPQSLFTMLHLFTNENKPLR